jgi:hypothetical protein
VAFPSRAAARANEALLAGTPAAGVLGAVDLARFRPAAPDPRLRAALGLAPGAAGLGAVARVQAHRRFDLLLEAFRRVVAGGLDAELLVVGRGTRLAELAREPAERLGLGRPVVFAGHRGADYPDVLRTIDLLAYLVPGSDGSCRAVLEAAACGIPSVATGRGALPELVVHGETGLVVGEDAESLAAAIGALLADPARRGALGAAARARAEALFAPERLAERVAALYREALARRREAGSMNSALLRLAPPSPIPLEPGEGLAQRRAASRPEHVSVGQAHAIEVEREQAVDGGAGGGAVADAALHHEVRTEAPVGAGDPEPERAAPRPGRRDVHAQVGQHEGPAREVEEDDLVQVGRAGEEVVLECARERGDGGVGHHAVEGEVASLLGEAGWPEQTGGRVDALPVAGEEVMDAIRREDDADRAERVHRAPRVWVGRHGRVQEQAAVREPHDRHARPDLEPPEEPERALRRPESLAEGLEPAHGGAPGDARACRGGLASDCEATSSR